MKRFAPSGGPLFMVTCLLFAPSTHAQIYSQVGNRIAFEAEGFTSHTPRQGHQWSFGNGTNGYTGSGYLAALPDLGSNINADIEIASPELTYQVSFPTSGTYYVWARGYAADPESDSLHVGLDGVATTNLSWFPDHGFWNWKNTPQAGFGHAAIQIPTTGVHTFHVWMREDGLLLDSIVLANSTGFVGTTGNAWHQPGHDEPGYASMRLPYKPLFRETAVTFVSGNQFQGGANQGNQLQTGSAMFYKTTDSTNWTEMALLFDTQHGNNKYYASNIPSDTFQAGDVVEYYFRIPYSDRPTTYIFSTGYVSTVTEVESVARANPFSVTIQKTVSGPGQPSPPDWRDLVVYQVITDRFYDGDPSNNNSNPEWAYNPASSNGIHGGDFSGIADKLEYIKALGADALWISPVQLNAGNASYHGYGAHDFYELAPHWGSMDDFRAMVSAAHDRGMYVILDIVANHQSRRIDSTDPGFPAYVGPPGGYTLRWTTGTQYPWPFNSLAYFHNHGTIGNYSGTEKLVGDLNGLDDLRTEDAYIRTNLLEIYKYWIRQADLDGLRLDTVPHVDIGFWQYFNPAIRAYAASIGKTNFMQYGEVFADSDATCGYFTGTKAGGAFANDSVLDYPLYFDIASVFANANGNTKQIEDHYNAIAANYDPAAAYRLFTFVDNHDNNRFLSSPNANNDQNRLKLALTFLHSSRGIPVVYYGTEQAFNGLTANHGNREDMFDGLYESGPSLGDNFDMTHPLYRHMALMNNFRRLYPSLRRGTHLNRWYDSDSPGLFAYARRLGDEEVFVVLNSATSSQTLTNRLSLYAEGTVLVNLLDTNEIVVVEAGALGMPVLEVPPRSAKLFIAQSLWQPLDPVVTAQSPAHDASGLDPTNTVLTLTFSKPMQTTEVVNAFSVLPPIPGTYTWDAGATQVTFHPVPPGFAGETRYTVTLSTNAADAVHSNRLYARYQSIFTTGSAFLPDTDGDHIPDWWMNLHFGHPTGEAGDESLDTDDRDNDGHTTYEEYLANTDPLSGTDVLAVSIEGTNDAVLVRFASKVQRFYDLEGIPVLGGTNWLTLMDDEAGTGAHLFYLYSNLVDRFYFRATARME